MGWYPPAVRKEVTRHRTALAANKTIYHTAVSDGTSLFTYFNQPGNPTSHFYVRETGVVEQYVDTRYRAPCNLEGNDCAVSIETWDGGGSSTQINNKPWNPAQVDALTALTRWIGNTHSIPFDLIPDSKHERRGFGYHRQGVDPYRASGGELWSNAYGKICPGDARISQIRGIVTAAATGDDDMTPEQAQQLDSVHRAMARLEGNDPSGENSIEWRVWNYGRGPAVRTEISNTLALVTATADKVGAITDIDDETLAEIAAAVADEQARRLEA